MNKNSNSKSDIEWLKKKFKQYGVAKNDLTTLKIRMDEIPVSLAIAQAAKETGGEPQGLHKKEMHYLVNGLGQEMELSQQQLIMNQS